MSKKILIINGHPDPSAARSTAVAVAAYESAAREAGHDVRRIDLGTLTFPPITSGNEHEFDAPPAIAEAQESITWSDHLVIAYPLWLGSPPALLKSYFEQICRYGFSFTHDITPLLTGRSARLIVTALISQEDWDAGDRLGTDGFAYSVLRASGFAPIETTLVSQMFTPELGSHEAELAALGRAGS